MEPDLFHLYELMLRSRLFEKGVSQLWNEGLISGEMHLSMGEEAIAAGIISQLSEGDAMALDHRGTAPLLVRGVDPLLLLKEFLGQPDGLCGGMGGHMHLFSPQHLAASSGIVGAAGPASLGFALAAKRMHPGNLAVAFFGEGALNQGMLMESFNLAVAWNLPVIFVCKDNQWAVYTPSRSVSGTSPAERARGFGLQVIAADGLDVAEVWQAARQAVQRARSGGGPTFLHLTCVHLEGHFLGDQIFRSVRRPVEGLPTVLTMTKTLAKRNGAPLRKRIAAVQTITQRMRELTADAMNPKNDPVARARIRLSARELDVVELETRLKSENDQLLKAVLANNPSG